MSVLRCEHCGASVIDPEHACTAATPLTAEVAADLLRVGPAPDDEYAAWLDEAEAEIAARLQAGAR